MIGTIFIILCLAQATLYPVAANSGFGGARVQVTKRI